MKHGKKNKIGKEILKMKKGFSLLELMVVIFIMVLAVGITLASMNDTRALDEVESAARGIAGILREAQNSSLTGREHSYDDGSGVLEMRIPCNNGVTLKNNGPAEQLTVESNFIPKKNGSCNPPWDLIPERSVTFKKVVETVPPVNRIYFEIPSGKVLEEESVWEANVIVKKIGIKSKRNSNIKYSVCIYKSGKIAEVYGENCPS